MQIFELKKKMKEEKFIFDWPLLSLVYYIALLENSLDQTEPNK